MHTVTNQRPTPQLADNPAAILCGAAQAFARGDITWGTDWFINPDAGGCRCALGGIAYAAEPENVDGNPMLISPLFRPVATAAATALADYLVNVLGATRCEDTSDLDGVIETVGGWNDAPGRTVDEVVAALTAAAERAVAA